MIAYYSDGFVLPLPAGHRFPMEKYARLRERVANELPPGAVTLELPPAATDMQILRAHSPVWLEQVVSGILPAQRLREIGFPWSAAMVERSRRSSGATIAACRAALEQGTAVNLAGGTHHAFRDHGGGYCVFNDAAIAATALQAEGRVRRVAVIDCDVHQGDGTAAILRDDESVFTFSMHGRNNYPFVKQRSDLDIELEDGTADEAYLDLLSPALDHVLASSRAGLAIYLAGADPFSGDRLGRLALSKAGLRARDRMVLDRCARAGVAVAVCMAGGYANDIADTVDIHLSTVAAAAGI